MKVSAQGEATLEISSSLKHIEDSRAGMKTDLGMTKALKILLVPHDEPFQASFSPHYALF